MVPSGEWRDDALMELGPPLAALKQDFESLRWHLKRTPRVSDAAEGGKSQGSFGPYSMPNSSMKNPQTTA